MMNSFVYLIGIGKSIEGQICQNKSQISNLKNPKNLQNLRKKNLQIYLRYFFFDLYALRGKPSELHHRHTHEEQSSFIFHQTGTISNDCTGTSFLVVFNTFNFCTLVTWMTEKINGMFLLKKCGMWRCLLPFW